MDIRDLSIGDWVLDGNDNPAQILAIENWSDGYVLNVRIKDMGIGVVVITRVRPILITQEILEKNGFVKNLGIYYHSEVLFELERVRDTWHRTFSAGEYDLYEIKYVHQLQHALRLVGVGKEIEL